MHKSIILLTVLFIGIFMTSLLGINATRIFAKHRSIYNFNKINQLNINIEYFFSVIGIISGCIAVTLIYVSWKKYRGEKEKKNKRRLK